MSTKPTALRLYNYFRSSASYRVRAALHLKNIPFEYVVVHLLNNGGEQKSADHHKRNPLEQVPALEFQMAGETRVIAQSIAMMEFLDEAFPETPILPKDAYLRARCRELAEIVNAGIQPHQNLDPMRRIDMLKEGAGKEHAQVYNRLGLAAFEERVVETRGRFSIGDSVTIADLCLIPQLVAARRFEVPLTSYPNILEIEANCVALPAFQKAHPDQQPDAK